MNTTERPPAGRVTRYATVVADPPWPQKGGGPLAGGHAKGFIGTTGSRPMPYLTMTIPQIAAMPIGDVAAKDAHLYLWTTNHFLPDAFAVMASWGFRYSTTIVWGKAPIGAGLGGAHGIATEFVLFGRRGNLRATGRIGRNWFNWKRPYNEQGKPMHSAKPPEFYAEVVEPISPGPRLEMFARRTRPGWDVWGDQAPGSIRIPALDEPETSLLDLPEDGAA